MSPEEVTCKLECQDLIVKYFIVLDRGPRSEIGNLFTGDVTLGATGQGATEAFANLPAEFAPVHLVTNAMVTPTGPDTAEGVVYCVAYNTFGSAESVSPREMPAAPNRIGVISFGFRKTALGWRISEFKPGVPAFDDRRT